MEFHFSTLLWYLGLLIISYSFASAAEKTHNTNKKKKLFFSSYLFVLLFCVFRFFVGNDYSGYYDGFKLIQSYEENVLLWEPGFYLLNRLFSYSDIGYLYTIGISSFITISFLFLAVWNEGNLKYGVFCIISLGLLIFVNDVIRQGIALSICLWSTKFLKTDNNLKFVVSVLTASLFHYTSIIFLGALLIKKINIPTYVWFLLLILVIGLQLSGFALKTYKIIMSYVPMYGEGYLEKDNYNTTQRIGLSILFNYIIALPFIFNINKLKEDRTLVNLYLCGLLIRGLFFGFLTFERIGMYFYAAQILIYPKFLKNYSSRRLLMIIIGIYFSLQSFLALEKHGAVPYRTLFYENLETPHYDRSDQEKN